jgi:hypothetical protein
MNQLLNSRRNFLGTLAILTSGTVVAGSPLSLFDNDATGDNTVEKTWNEFIKNSGASRFLNITGITLPHNLTAINGLVNKAGDIVSFEKENMLALPTWIYWGNNRNRPDDVIVSFFENSYPYKKIKSIDRFELKALVKLGNTNGDDNLLQAICTKQHGLNAAKTKLVVQTRITKKKHVQDISLYNNNNIVLKEQLFYNI